MKKKLILVTFLICVIILGILMFLINILNNQDNSNIVSEEPFEELAKEEYKQGKIVPQNFTPIMREYTGEVKTEDWYIHIYKFVDTYIPEIQKSTNISSYYDENILDIKTDLGIDSYEDFEKLANQVKNISESATFKDSEFDITDIDVNDKSVSAKLKIFFTNNEELNVKFIIYNMIKDNVKITFLPQ